MRKSYCPRCDCIQPVNVGRTRNRSTGIKGKRHRTCTCVGINPRDQEYCGQVFITEERIYKMLPRRRQQTLFAS